MKAVAIFLTTAIAVIATGWGLGDAADKPAYKFGPEWKLNKDGDIYYKKMEIPVGRRNNGAEWAWYTVEMEKNTVQITEYDDNRGVTISAAPKGDLGAQYGELQVHKDDKGKAREITIRLSKNNYFDLDGDGVIDAFYDNTKSDGVPMVIFEGRFVQVENFKSGFSVAKGQKPKMWGIGRKVQYVFDKGVWNEVPVK